MTILCIPHAADLVRGGPGCTLCALEARLAVAMSPKTIIIKDDRYEIRPCEDGTVDILWAGPADSASVIDLTPAKGG